MDSDCEVTADCGRQTQHSLTVFGICVTNQRSPDWHNGSFGTNQYVVEVKLEISFDPHPYSFSHDMIIPYVTDLAI